MQRLLSGEPLTSIASLKDIPVAIRDGVLQSLSPLMANLALPVAACVVLKMLTGADDTGFMMRLLCALCCGTVLSKAWLDAQGRVAALIDVVLRATETLTPVMASAAALTGGTFLSSAMRPLSMLCAAMFQSVLKDWGLKLCACAAVVALSGAVSERYALNRLFDLLKSVTRWILGLTVFLYGGLLSAQGVVSAAKDGAALQTAKVAIENIVPIIGGGVSDAAGSIAVSAGLARRAVGITGVALIVRMCASPVLKLAAGMLALKLIAALMEPLAEGASASLIAHFGEIFEMLLAIAICCGLMAAMIPIGCAALTGGMTQ